LIVPGLPGRERLDRFLAARLRECSRSYVQKLIRAGAVLLDGAPAKASRAVAGGQRLAIAFPPAEAEPAAVPEDLPVSILYEDELMVAVDKPAGMPTHPSCGHARGTLANAMAFHCRGQLSGLNGPVRPGIVHRLDMDTSGVIVVAKTDPAHRELARQFAERLVAKTYLALVHGRMRPERGQIDRALGRHPVERKRQAVRRSGGRRALTDYHTLEVWKDFSCLRLAPHTGRTHQLRVHLASAGCPILCDGLYGREVEFPASAPVLRRQALHAAELRVTHPGSGRPLVFRAPVPEDFAAARELLRSGGGA
jgi:23S rRNA pseudouridine1911/1915/1917 synthase